MQSRKNKIFILLLRLSFSLALFSQEKKEIVDADFPFMVGNVGFAVDTCGQVIVRTNTSSQIRYRCSANTAIGIATLGWLDRRGRDD